MVTCDRNFRTGYGQMSLLASKKSFRSSRRKFYLRNKKEQKVWANGFSRESSLSTTALYSPLEIHRLLPSPHSSLLQVFPHRAWTLQDDPSSLQTKTTSARSWELGFPATALLLTKIRSPGGRRGAAIGTSRTLDLRSRLRDLGGSATTRDSRTLAPTSWNPVPSARGGWGTTGTSSCTGWRLSDIRNIFWTPFVLFLIKVTLTKRYLNVFMHLESATSPT